MQSSKALLVGITGGIGSGKSTVCRIFEVLGIPVYNSDDQAKNLMTTDTELANGIKAKFGDESYADGVLNRAFLAKEVFSKPERLRQLNALVHPAVGRDFSKWVALHQSAPYVIKEAALLFETGSYKSLATTILITAPEDVRIERVLLRDPQRSRQQVKDIIGNQMKDEAKTELADYVLKNDEKSLLIPQVIALHHTLADLANEKAQQEA